VRFFFTYDNYGIDLTGKNRLSTGFNFGNLFNMDQQVNFQYTTSTQSIFNSLMRIRVVGLFRFLGGII